MPKNMQLYNPDDGADNIIIGNSDINSQYVLTITSNDPAVDLANLPYFYKNLQ